MGYLQLAENNDPMYHLAEIPAQYMDLYIFIPAGYRGASKDMYIREDVFDDLPQATYAQIMQELGDYQNKGLSAASDRASRKADRAKSRTDRNTRKNTRSEAGAMRQAARTERQKLRSEKGGGFKGVLDTLVGGAKDIFGKGDVAVTAGGGALDINYSQGNEESFFSRYKIPLALGGIAIIGGAIYLTMRKK